METNIRFIHQELVEKSKLGDRNAQFQLYEKYVDAMYNVSMRMLGSREDAEDMVQDSFVEAFKNLVHFRYESTFGSWLKRIVINKSINHLKSRRIPLVSLESEEYPVTEEQVDAADAVEIHKVKAGIKKLPAGYQQIINLYLIEGYDHEEIGEVLGITTSTSKSQYHRAKKKLLEIIKAL